MIDPTFQNNLHESLLYKQNLSVVQLNVTKFQPKFGYIFIMFPKK
jgi:hypothetical protein